MSRRFYDLALTGAALLGAVCLAAALVVTVFDLRVLSFRSGSMSPTIPTGALAVARSVPAADLKVGDVVSVLTASGSRVTHRIVSVQVQDGVAVLALRGDANKATDAAPYRVSRADRVVYSVPRLGYVARAVTGPVGLVLLGSYAALLIGLITRGRRPRRRARPEVGRHRGLVAALTVALVATGAVSGLTLAGRSRGTMAFWTDAVGTTGSTFGAATIPPPATFTCGPIGFLSVTFSWSTVAGATTYTVHYGNGGASTLTTTGTSATVVTAVALTTAWVTAEQNFGSTTWTSAPSSTRSFAVAGVSICI